MPVFNPRRSSDFRNPVAVRLPPSHRAALQRIAQREGLSEGKLALKALMRETERLAAEMIEADRQALLNALEAERQAFTPERPTTYRAYAAPSQEKENAP